MVAQPILDFPLKLSTFESVTSQKINEDSLNWLDFVKKIRLFAPLKESKAQLPLLKLATFKSPVLTSEMRAKNIKTPRHNDNLASITGVEGDYDAGNMDIHEAAARLRRAGVLALLYTTPSCTIDAPRWRVLAPCSTALPVSKRSQLLDRLNGALGGVLGNESWTRSQAYYYGIVEGVEYETEYCEGRFINDPELILSPRGKRRGGTVVPINTDIDLCGILNLDDAEYARVRSALALIPSDDRKVWVRYGCALACYGERGKELWLEWSQKSERWRDGDEKEWDTFRPTEITPGSIFYDAKQRGWTEPSRLCESGPDYLTDVKGNLKRIHANLIVWLGRQPEAAGFGYNLFAERAEYNRAPLKDCCYNELRERAERSTGIPWSRNAVIEAVDYLVHRREYHPVLDYLRGLQWDGNPRVDTFLRNYYHISDSDYIRAASRLLFLSAVWRVMEPGCVVDQSILMVGGEGVGKSKGVSALFGHDPEWVLDRIPDLHHRDSQSILRGKWAVELSEMAAAKRTDRETLFAFMTRREEYFRPSYGRNELYLKRQCILVGTTNDFQILSALDGNRRFLPIIIKQNANIEEITMARDQLLAEAYLRALCGERPEYLTPGWYPELGRVRESVSNIDAFEDPVTEYVRDKETVKISDVLLFACGIGYANQHAAMQKRVAQILRQLGFEPTRAYENGVKVRGWARVQGTNGATT